MSATETRLVEVFFRGTLLGSPADLWWLERKIWMDPRLDSALRDARARTGRGTPQDFLLGTATAAFQIEGAAGGFNWSLMDSSGWAWAYAERFGIIYVDFPTGGRTLKDSAEHFREIIATQELDICHDAGKLVRRGTIMENVALF